MEKKEIQELIGQTVEETVKSVESTIDTKLKAFGMTEDRKESVAKLFASPVTQTATERKGLSGELKKGHAFARMVKLAWQAKHANEEQLQTEDFIVSKAEKMYGKDKNFCTMVKHFAGKTKAPEFQNVTNPADGGYLVEEMYGELVELLRERVFLYKVGARVTPMPNGNLNLPVHTAGALSYFIGEGKPVFAQKQAFGNIKLSAKKQVSMVIISDELMMTNTYEADQRLLDDILLEMEVTMNYVALYGTGTEFTPKGLKNYDISKLTLNADVDGKTAAVLKGTILATNVPGKSLGYVMNGALWAPFYNVTDGNGAYIHREEMSRGTLVGSPFHLFNKIPIDSTADKKTDLFFGDWSEFEIGEQKMFQIDTSKEASIKDSAGETVNLFQQGMTAIKVTSFYDFALRHKEGFVVYTGVHTV
jgi:HK97 family phage major capsid protein